MRKRLWRGLIGVAIAVVCFLLLWVGGMDRGRLLERSTRITAVQGWGLQKPDIVISSWTYGLLTGGAQYQWVGNGQILFFHDLAPIQLTAASLNWSASVGTPALYDVSAHSERPLPKLAELFHRAGGEAKTATVSPDGTHLLWRDGQSHVHCSMLDGSRHINAEMNGDLHAGWMADSKRFYTYGFSEDEQQQNVISVHPRDIDDGKSLDQIQFTQMTAYTHLSDYILTPDGYLVTNSFRSLDLSSVRSFKIVGLRPGYFTQTPEVKPTLILVTPAPNSIAHAVTLTLPAGSTVQSLVYSPRGDKLAWIINRTVPAPFAFLHRWWPSYKAIPQKTTALWVSGTLGENLHEIGHIPITEHGRHFYLLDYVRWQPDGKTLSFVSNDTLYTVPAD